MKGKERKERERKGVRGWENGVRTGDTLQNRQDSHTSQILNFGEGQEGEKERERNEKGRKGKRKGS